MFEYHSLLFELSNVFVLRNNTASNNNTSNSLFKDQMLVLICLIAILFSSLFLWYIYKRYIRYMNQEGNEQQENNGLADVDRIQIEMQELDGRNFAFIPMNSPIKIGESESPIESRDSFNSEKTNDSSGDIKKKNNFHAKMKNDNISYFNHNVNNVNNENIEVIDRK